MEEITDIRRVVEESDFPPRYKAILLTLIEEVVTIKKTKREKQAELERIRRMLGPSSEKRPKNDEQTAKEGKKPPPARNHGRHGAKDYKFSDTIEHPHQKLKAGQCCPDCDHGTLQEIEPRKIIRLIGNAPIEAELHKPARLRCGGCGKIFTAALPPDVSEEKADASANSIVAFFHYGMGIPLYRLAAIQRVMGVPLPAATQYEMVEMLWTKVVPVFKALLHQAADLAPGVR
ncbi:MAG: hypothetical protein HQM09_24220 [Candidatus Riflebacteria bacterium]|nr:hypothetical protein [Candidatus Riflebacteria bacterium]